MEVESLVTDNPFSPTDLMEKALLRRGYQTESFLLEGKAYLRAQAPNGWVLLTPRRFFIYPFTSVISRNISIDKDRAYAFVQRLGITVPQSLVLPGASSEDLRSFLDNYAPLVVKPVDGHGGAGVVLNITSYDALQEATQRALSVSNRVLVQQQVVGEEVRITVFEGKVVSAILRQTARVVGDGRHTIAELISAENDVRKELRFEYLRYPLLNEQLVEPALLHSQDVPAAGEVVELNKSTLIRGGASFYNVTDQLHETYKQAAIKLASELPSEFLVVDMIIGDVAQPMTATSYAFIEFNTAPSLRIYYVVRDRNVYDIVSRLVDKIDQLATAPRS